MSLLVRIYFNAIFGALGGLLGSLLYGAFGTKLITEKPFRDGCLEAVSVHPPYTFELVGGTLPLGLRLNPDGSFSCSFQGMPTASDPRGALVTIRVRDSRPYFHDHLVAIVVVGFAGTLFA